MADDIHVSMNRPPIVVPRSRASMRVEERPALPLVLEELYRDHFDFVYRAAARLGGPGFDAEDAAQEVFLVVARRLDSYDGSCRITTWLFGIALNVVRAQRRRARIRRLWERKELDEQPTTPLASIDQVELRQAHRLAYQILDKLAPKKREVFILAELEGLSCEEIATIVDAKVETIWSRLHYARSEFEERAAKLARGPR